MDEASYEGNMGAIEVMKFYQSATDSQIDKLERFIARQDWSKAWQLVQKVTGVKLMGNAFESALLNEIGDAGARPYQLKIDKNKIDNRRSTFVVKNEDFDVDDPNKMWGGIEMFVASRVEPIYINNKTFTLLKVSFGKNYMGGGSSREVTSQKFGTLNIGLKYLFRIMSTVLQHLSKHIEDYGQVRGLRPLDGIIFASSDFKGDVGSSRGKKQRDRLYKAYIERNIRKIAPLAKVVEKNNNIIVLFRNDQLLVKP